MKVEDATWDAEVMKASELVMVDFLGRLVRPLPNGGAYRR